jgi:phage recombination protein Bet
MTNALTTIDYTNEQTLTTLRDTVAKNATPAELAMFIEFAKGTGLNPFKKEIWFIKGNDGRIQMMTGINGFWTLANSFAEFDGAEGGLIDTEGNWVKSVPNGNFIGAWCRVYRKDRRIAMEGEAMLSDYSKAFGLWKTAPRIMIRKVAESIALRKAFPQQLNGLYTAEEMPESYQVKAEVVEDKPRFEGKTVAIFPEQQETLDKHLAAKANGYAREKVDTETGEVKPIKAQVTFYDIRTLEGAAAVKSRKYLEECAAKEVFPGVFKSPIRLSKLTGCIVSEESLEEGSQDDFPNV